MLENKTIILYNLALFMSIKPGFVKTSMQVIYIIYYANIYFLVIYNT